MDKVNQSSRRRILLFANHFSYYTLTLLRLMNSPSLEILCVLNGSNVLHEIHDPSIADDSRLVIRRIGSLRSPVTLMRGIKDYILLLKAFKPDLVHFQETAGEDTFLCWMISRSSKRILTVHDVIPHSGRDSKKGVRDRTYRNIMRATADKVIVHGPYSKEVARSEHTKRSSVSVVPHPILFPQVSEQRAQILPLSKVKTLLIGRMEDYKGLTYLLAASKIVRNLGHRLEVRVAGSGPSLMCLPSPLPKWISVVDKFLTPKEYDTEFANADIVALPYTEATSSGIFASAVGHGKAVVHTSVGDLPTSFKALVPQVSVPPRDATAFAHGLVKIIESLNDYAGGTLGLSQSHLDFNLEIGRVTQSVYQETLAEAKRK